MGASRRDLIVGAGLLAAAASSTARAAPNAADAASHQGVLERYAGFGVKASGGPGDTACGAWLEAELTALGYRCQRQAFEVPYAEVRTATLTTGDRRAVVLPQAIVRPTGPGSLSAPLRLASAGASLEGAIALIVLPHRRWGALADPAVSGRLTDAFARGAAAAVLVPTGPTGEAIALNVSATQPGFQKPIAILAPKDAEPFVAAAAMGAGAAQAATLTVDAAVGRRPAYNVIARLDRGAAKTLIVTTPRSGWFTCAGERGSGVAVWLSLARWLAATKPAVNLEFVATSGHEYVFLGGERYLEHLAPKPADTHLWAHIGASAAARDWHEIGGSLSPLPSADSQRAVVATPQLIDGVRRAFQGLSGLEAVRPADKGGGGELAIAIDAGYPSAIGLSGAHRYFHTAQDDMRCVSGDLVAPVAQALRAAIAGTL